MGKVKLVCLLGVGAGVLMQGVPAPLRAADAQRYAKVLTPLLDAAGGKSIGALAPGAAVTVTGQSGSATHVALPGWSAQGSTAVVATPERPVVLVSGYSGHATPGAAKAANGVTYHAVTVDGWVASGALTDDVQTVWKSADALFKEKCGSCHALPAVNALTVKQWPAILKTQAVNAGLDAGEAALLTAYLQTHTTR